MYIYYIDINFNRGASGDTAIGRQAVPCYRGNGRRDTMIFNKSMVKIIAKRQYYYKSKNILIRGNNNIGTQILKAILLFYANCSSFPAIRQIKINVLKETELLDTYSYSPMDIVQVVLDTMPRELSFVPSACFYEENKKGNSFRIALSHWLEALNISNECTRLVRLWTALNALYSYYDQQDQQDLDKQIYFCEQLKAHSDAFADVTSIVTPFPASRLRVFRWKEMMLNNIKRHGDAGNLCNFIQRHEDSRLKEVFIATLADRKINSKIDEYEKGTKETETFLSTAGITDDMDVLMVICIQYAYFLRNHIVHGNTWDYQFSLAKNEHPEVEEVNLLLSKLIMEIFKQPNVIQEKP